MSFYVVFKYEKSDFDLKKKGVNGSKDVRLKGWPTQPPHIFTSPNLALFAKSLGTPAVDHGHIHAITRFFFSFFLAIVCY